MRFYAERPTRFLLQIVVDVLVVAWVWLCVDVASTAREVLLRLQTPANTLSGAGDGIRGVFDEAARTAGELPLVGEDLARALGAGTGAGDSIATAGRDLAGTVGTIASGTAIGIVVLGALPVVLTWLPLRLRYARSAASAAQVRGVDTDLLALRAITNRPVRRLLRVSPDPAAAWRRDDREAVQALAALELRALGLRAPHRTPD
ncbi:hypothetical protein [Pseudonocardia lacus]|uniref:hypothetical protein n=1 Tax=Pseudonocardia lacus TaxID=2835865 RepID=UPI001BDD9B00|nr:hypothetical protein [Pseudonocardia lacus]